MRNRIRLSNLCRTISSSNMPVKKQSTTEYSRVYKGEDSTATWTYDPSKYKFGPISVSVEYHDDLVERKPKKKKK